MAAFKDPEVMAALQDGNSLSHICLFACCKLGAVKDDFCYLRLSCIHNYLRGSFAE